MSLFIFVGAGPFINNDRPQSVSTLNCNGVSPGRPDLVPRIDSGPFDYTTRLVL